ncbi:hypothetical protein MCHI_000722 [Candidatus Magnetoovum chiemensis]|nr:hypothetical protein MCHI_000722 [Candidatus Magnetoovum chiemensis]
MAMFNDLIDLSRKFVEYNNGAWNNDAWLSFLSEVQKKGFHLNGDMREYVGQVLESFKDYYNAVNTSAHVQDYINDITDTTVDFLKKTKGKWDYSEWEAFINKLNSKGYNLSVETIYYLNNVLESVRRIYTYTIW